MKRSPWFPMSVKPVHIGEYEVDWSNPGGLYRRHWDGECWTHTGRHLGVLSAFNGSPNAQGWRGLAEKPA